MSVSESVNPYLTTGPGSSGAVWPPAGAVLDVKDTAASMTVALAPDLPARANQAWIGFNLAPLLAPEVPMTVQAPPWVATAMSTAPEDEDNGHLR